MLGRNHQYDQEMDKEKAEEILTKLTVWQGLR